jgi:CubicO group peptidase (beta-lactamase class C family)
MAAMINSHEHGPSGGSATRRRLLRFVVVGAGVLALVGPVAGRGLALVEPAKIDAVFAKWTSTTPGCAVGVSVGGAVVLERAYGMADLEHNVRNSTQTIFEAGSVSKQFTAAAVLLLARDGKLSLDDQARKYIPELPDYGHSLTIRHLLQHTSGLRDWGEVESIAGWPRTSRVYTHANVLDIVRRQKSLNFVPGTKWSYCNTGYNLAAIIVTRVSGQPFSDFCRQRIFVPLGMTHTSWRDDFRRIVKDRAIAYDAAKDTYRQKPPFEDVHGNGGLLTTVGDLLRWNENAVKQKVGDAEFLREELTPGHFNDGTAHNYAMGLYIRTYRGLLPEVSHSGSTAGYRAFLTRFPEQRVSVAVLCNASTANAEQYARGVADLFLADTYERVQPATPSVDELKPLIGTYVSDEAEVEMQVVTEGAQLRILRRPNTSLTLKPIYRDAFSAPGLGLVRFRRDGTDRVIALSVTVDRVWDMRFERK